MGYDQTMQYNHLVKSIQLHVHSYIISVHIITFLDNNILTQLSKIAFF